MESARLSLSYLGHCCCSAVALSIPLCGPLKTAAFQKQAARKLRLLASGNAKDAPLSVENDSKKEATSGVLRHKGDGIADANPEVVDSAAASSAAPCPEIASVLGGVSSDTHLTSVDEEPAAADEVAASVGQGIDDLGTKGSQDNRDTVKAPGKNDHPGQGKAYNNGDNDDDDDDGDEHSDDQDDNNGSGSSDDGGTGSNDWADVEASERTGYAGAAVEPFAVKEGINGASVMEVSEKCGAALEWRTNIGLGSRASRSILPTPERREVYLECYALARDVVCVRCFVGCCLSPRGGRTNTPLCSSRKV